METKLNVVPDPTKVVLLERYFRDPIVGEGILASCDTDVASHNICEGLRLLGYRVATQRRIDEDFRRVVVTFQQDQQHKNQDGLFGPGTRRLLAETLIGKIGDDVFSRLKEIPIKGSPLVFLSYAWKDAPKVNKIDQWLRDHGIRVRRDNRDFVPGMQLPDVIADAITECDKVLVVYSRYSKERDWPSFERGIAEQKERSGESGIIIYLLLDDTPLPKHDPNRIAVVAVDRKLKEFGEDILRGVLGQKTDAPRYEYDENESF